jgi:hypothetical protein
MNVEWEGFHEDQCKQGIWLDVDRRSWSQNKTCRLSVLSNLKEREKKKQTKKNKQTKKKTSRTLSWMCTLWELTGAVLAEKPDSLLPLAFYIYITFLLSLEFCSIDVKKKIIKRVVFLQQQRQQSKAMPFICSISVAGNITLAGVGLHSHSRFTPAMLHHRLPRQTTIRSKEYNL